MVIIIRNNNNNNDNNNNNNNNNNRNFLELHRNWDRHTGCLQSSVVYGCKIISNDTHLSKHKNSFK